MQRTIAYALVLLLIAAIATGCDHGRDLDNVCQEFARLAAEPALEELTPNQRFDLVNKRVAERLWRFSQVGALWEHVPNYESEARYRMFKRTAEELLGRPWDCPDMQRLAPRLSEPVMEH